MRQRGIGAFKMGPDKKRKIIGLLAYVFSACLLVLLLRPYYLFSILIVLALPSLANFLWLKNSRKRIFVFSLASALIFAPAVELASRLANVWDVQSVFPRPFGLVPLENMLFAFLNFFWALSFYEYFVVGDKAGAMSKKFKYLIVIYSLAAAAVYLLYFYDKNLVALNYFQMALLALAVPFLLIFSKRPALLKKTILPTAFFAVIFFVYELVSLQTGSWWWPGEYLFSFNIGGKIFPLDDVVIWYFLSTPVLIGGYEFFAINR